MSALQALSGLLPYLQNIESRPRGLYFGDVHDSNQAEGRRNSHARGDNCEEYNSNGSPDGMPLSNTGVYRRRFLAGRETSTLAEVSTVDCDFRLRVDESESDA